MPFSRKTFAYIILLSGLGTLAYLILLLNFSRATDYMYHAVVKDPERHAPEGNVIVSPADGTVMYVREVKDGIIPMVVKQGVEVPIEEHLKTDPVRPFKKGYLIGIYMNTQGVHVNRVPNDAKVIGQKIYNGPHMDMTQAETEIMLSQLTPGMVSLKKLFGIEPFNLENKADFILKSARETLTLEDKDGYLMYVVRIADFYVGKIITWIQKDTDVKRGDKLGMIVWGSQTDIFIEERPGLEITTSAGDYVYGAETIIATYE